MFAVKFVFIVALMCWSVKAATVAPPPVFQTLDAVNSDIGPKFTTHNRNDGGKAEVEDEKYWKGVALKQLKKIVEAAKKQKDTTYSRKAKNVIIFVGDGMGLTTITAGRIYKGQYMNNTKGEQEMLAFDEFPFTGLAKTYNVDKQVPDSAGTATAMFCGSKSDYGAIGMDSRRSKTNASKGRLTSIMDWAQAEGKRTGIVTTTRITHATPAATFARIYHRDWECDTKVPLESKQQYADIARQLIENAPGNKFNVIMGGGLSVMGALNDSEIHSVRFEGDTEISCTRGDQRNLVQEWLSLKENASNITQSGNKSESTDPINGRVFVHSREQLLNMDVKNVDHVLGLFRNNHITYSVARQEGEPSLKEMVQAALGVLNKEDSNGFVLMVEGGRIDMAHHQNYANAAMREVLELDMAVQAALDLTSEEETLVIVTADHSHALTLNGYPARNEDILGFGNKPNEPMVYETLSYANGPGYWDHLANNTNSSTFWQPLEALSSEQRLSPTYRHMAMMPLNSETHGGEDVIVFANGPGSSLVRGVFEQNYVAYVMSYAGCMGPAKYFDKTCAVRYNRSGGNSLKSWGAMLWILMVLKVLW